MGALRDAIKVAVAALASRGCDVGVLKDAGSLAGRKFSLVVFASEEAVRFAEGLGYNFNDDPGLPPSALIFPHEIRSLVSKARRQGLVVDA